jgi:hypothetical protein
VNVSELGEKYNETASPLRLITTGLLGFICRQYGEPFQLGADKRRTQDIQTQILDIDSLHIYTLEKYCRRHQNIKHTGFHDKTN